MAEDYETLKQQMGRNNCSIEILFIKITLIREINAEPEKTNYFSFIEFIKDVPIQRNYDPLKYLKTRKKTKGSNKKTK